MNSVMIRPQPPSERITRRKTVSVTPAMGARNCRRTNGQIANFDFGGNMAQLYFMEVPPAGRPMPPAPAPARSRSDVRGRRGFNRKRLTGATSVAGFGRLLPNERSQILWNRQKNYRSLAPRRAPVRLQP